MKLSDLFFKFISPPQCISCNKILSITSNIPFICDKCRENISFIRIRTCPTCLKPLDIKDYAPYCAYCSGGKYRFNYLIGFAQYNNSIKNAIVNLKFRGKPYYSKSLAYFLYERLVPELSKVKPDAIVFTPISIERYKQRGYNQSKLIAQELSRLTGIPIVNALIKIRDTKPQSSLSYEERETNLKNAIIPQKSLKYNTVLLIDDVYTTGSTAKACCIALKASGVKNIIVGVCAITGDGIYENKT